MSTLWWITLKFPVCPLPCVAYLLYGTFSACCGDKSTVIPKQIFTGFLYLVEVCSCNLNLCGYWLVEVVECYVNYGYVFLLSWKFSIPIFLFEGVLSLKTSQVPKEIKYLIATECDLKRKQLLIFYTSLHILYDKKLTDFSLDSIPLTAPHTGTTPYSASAVGEDNRQQVPHSLLMMDNHLMVEGSDQQIASPTVANIDTPPVPPPASQCRKASGT
uniref:Uncharacterized protein n=1 Tax=Glossina pallidipes TaxID=7398 RepID=A0A1B0ACE3_GLOPL